MNHPMFRLRFAALVVTVAAVAVPAAASDPGEVSPVYVQGIF